jgi:hypothetical protein
MSMKNLPLPLPGPHYADLLTLTWARSPYGVSHPTLSPNKHPPTLTVSGLCYDVGYQDTPTVLVIASGSAKLRGAFF